MESFTISGQIVNKKEKEFLAKNNCRWCSKCKKAKTINEFWPSQYGCIQCVKEKKEQWTQLNPNYFSNYRNTNREKQKDRHRSWFERNREKKNKQNKDWYYANKEKVKEKNRRNRNKYKTNPTFKVRNALRQRVYSFLLGSKSQKTMDLIGCSIEKLKQHLESQFVEGMTWENYGNPNGDHTDCWHIDHIRPCNSFDLTKETDQKECFHYSNLQPLWGKDNIKKGSKY
jgi:hypothetical protein